MVAMEMVRYQNAGYRLVSLITQQSPADPESRDRDRRVFTRFQLAGYLQVRIANHVHQQVDAAHVATKQAINVVTHWPAGS